MDSEDDDGPRDAFAIFRAAISATDHMKFDTLENLQQQNQIIQL